MRKAVEFIWIRVEVWILRRRLRRIIREGAKNGQEIRSDKIRGQ